MRPKMSIATAAFLILSISSSAEAVTSQTFATERLVVVSPGAVVVVATSPSFAITNGARYWVTSRLRLEDASAKTFIKGSLRCRDAFGAIINNGVPNDGSPLTAGENIFEYDDQPLVLSPRMLLKATATGPYTCEIAFVNGSTHSVVLLISGNSYIAVDGPQHSGSRMRREPDPDPDPDVSGTRLAVGEALDASEEDDFIIPDLTKPVRVSGDVQWTACNGQYDPEVGCLPSDPANTATIGFHVSVFQWNSAGTAYCHTWSAPFTYDSISSSGTHHTVTYSSATFQPNPNCPTRARIKIYIKNVGDPGDGALAVHANSTVLVARPEQ